MKLCTYKKNEFVFLICGFYFVCKMQSLCAFYVCAVRETDYIG